MQRLIIAAAIVFAATIAFPYSSEASLDCGLPVDSLAGGYAEVNFIPHGVGLQGQSFTWRDLEFMWDPQLGGVDATIDGYLLVLATNLSQLTGRNSYGLGFSDFAIGYDYFRRTNDVYNLTNPADTTVRIGFRSRLVGDVVANYPARDRSHLDVYLADETRDTIPGGTKLINTYPAQIIAPDEDLTTGHPNDPKPGNSVQVKLRHNAATDTAWTNQDRVWASGILHEMQHSLPPQHPFSGGPLEELFSSALEVVIGIRDTSTYGSFGNSEIPYHWSLLDFSPDALGSCHDVPRGTGPNYETRSLFAAYLAFNFLNSTSTLADDLLRQWSRSDRTMAALARRLRNDSCSTCQDAAYFNPGGQALGDNDRLVLLHHNWRIANYANETTLADHQYGYPTSFGFSPTKQFKCWQDFDNCALDDISVLPPEVLVEPAGTQVFAGVRAFRGNTADVTLRQYGAEYWVLRPSPGMLGTSHTLNVRIQPDDLCANDRWLASFICYDPPADSIQSGRLWAHPEWSTTVTAPQWMTPAAFSDRLDLELAGFGTTCKAAVLVLTRASGIAASETAPFSRYHLTVGIGDRDYAPSAPSALTHTALFEEGPSWSPAGDQLAYTRTDTLFRQSISGGTPTAIAPSSNRREGPDWSPRGDWIAYYEDDSTHSCDVYVYKVATGETRAVSDSMNVNDISPVFSPNGQQVAFLRLDPQSGIHQIRRVNLDGTGLKILAVGLSSALSLHWAPSGDSLFYINGTSNTLYAISSDGGPPVLKELAPNDTRAYDFSVGGGPMITAQSLAWHPCFFASLQATQTTLRSPASGPFRPVSRPDSLSLRNPRWSFDGTKVAWSGVAIGASSTTRDIYVQSMTTNHAPAMTVADQTLSLGVPFALNLSATDADGDSITYAAPPRYLPPGSTFSSNAFSWSNPAPADSDYYVVFRALDPYGGVANKVVKIRVAGGGSGGGCPFAETKTAQGWQVENSILGRSATGDLAADHYHLKHAPEIVSNKLRLQIRENEREVTTLDKVELVAIDHDAGSRVFSQGARWVLGSLQPAYLVRTASGENVTQRASAGAYYQGQPGETLYVDMVASGRGGASAGRSVVEDDEDGGGVLNGFQKDAGEENLRQQLPGTPVAQSTDTRVLEGTGILVQIPDGQGGWREVRHYYPREHADDCVVDSVGTKPMRLIFLAEHKLTILGRLVGATEAATTTVLELETAHHSRLGDVRNAVAGSGGPATELTTGDTLSLEFASAPVTGGLVRDYFLVSTGVYATATQASQRPVRDESLPNVFSLAQNQPNPFSRATDIAFALPVPTSVKLEVFDLAGRRVAVLADRSFPAGFHKVTWNRTDRAGALASPGVYLCRMTAGSFVEKKKMVLLPR